MAFQLHLESSLSNTNSTLIFLPQYLSPIWGMFSLHADPGVPSVVT